MANAFSRSIVLRPAGILADRTLEPFLQLICRHINRLVEVSVPGQLDECDSSKRPPRTHLMTSSVDFTMLEELVEKGLTD